MLYPQLAEGQFNGCICVCELKFSNTGTCGSDSVGWGRPVSFNHGSQHCKRHLPALKLLTRTTAQCPPTPSIHLVIKNDPMRHLCKHPLAQITVSLLLSKTIDPLDATTHWSLLHSWDHWCGRDNRGPPQLSSGKVLRILVIIKSFVVSYRDQPAPRILQWNNSST